MTTAGDNITVANITANVRTLSAYNGGIVWHAGNNPFAQNPAIPLAGGNASGYPTLYGDPITDTNITASTITANFRAYATQLSRIRNVRLLQWYQVQGDPRNTLNYDNTALTSLNSDYQWNPGGGPAAGDTISASALDTFVSELSTGINNYRVSTVTVEEFYCHSNCHGSCHGSL
jgi:hypothetical protein